MFTPQSEYKLKVIANRPTGQQTTIDSLTLTDDHIFYFSPIIQVIMLAMTSSNCQCKSQNLWNL